MSNINSFSDNLAKLTEQTTKAMSVLEGINEAFSGEVEKINVGKSTTLPSYNNIVSRLERAENTISKFVQGKGVVEADDGSYRKIKVSTISRPPETISGISNINNFSINPNWFFESLQYPRCIVKIDLTDKIDHSSDRVYVNRVILNLNDVTTDGTSLIDFYNENIKETNIGYNTLLNLLEANKIHYREDKDEIKLPLIYEKFKGTYGVTETRLIKNSNGESREWLFLDNISYSLVDENGKETSTGMALQEGDYLRFKNSLYKIIEIGGQAGEKRVRLEYAIGYETIGPGDILEFYNNPFANKIVEVGIGINEIDIIYFKGINKEYNLLSKDWSEPISFVTNELNFADDPNINFESYYIDNVADFGQTWIAQVKEGQIYSSRGKKPNAPIINADDLAVVQINTQLDATIDKETYNKLTSEIASTKSNIASIRHTIASNKDLLIQTSNTQDRTNIQNIINNDTTKLNSLNTQYNSLVNEINTLLNETGAINYSPKYHIRGFFGIPESMYANKDTKSGEQRIIGFDIMYRYLHMDETGIKLETYEYQDRTNNNIIQTGVFTDWNIMQSAILSKVLDKTTETYKWTDENPADGSQININQIDIPIRSGEKVEIKVRSISEAGYPYNPLKSDWSESVIISFPDNLTTDDSVTTMLDTIKNDMTAVVLQETMSAAGVYTHIADGTSLFKHKADNISYTETNDTGLNEVVTLTEMTVQNKLDSLSRSIKNLLSEMDKKLTDYNTQSLKSIDEKLSDINEKLNSLTTRVQALER